MTHNVPCGCFVFGFLDIGDDIPHGHLDNSLFSNDGILSTLTFFGC